MAIGEQHVTNLVDPATHPTVLGALADDIATRHLLFTGKGGVGKTTIAAATSVALADRGRRVLLVSTDPASNLDEVLGTTIGTALAVALVAGVATTRAAAARRRS